MASGVFEDEAEGTITINEYIERLDAEELVMFSFSS
jgi:E3 ubiquitin-protein ligase UBR7